MLCYSQPRTACPGAAGRTRRAAAVNTPCGARLTFGTPGGVGAQRGQVGGRQFDLPGTVLITLQLDTVERTCNRAPQRGGFSYSVGKGSFSFAANVFVAGTAFPSRICVDITAVEVHALLPRELVGRNAAHDTVPLSVTVLFETKHAACADRREYTHESA